jgi:hypothetical protein
MREPNGPPWTGIYPGGYGKGLLNLQRVARVGVIARSNHRSIDFGVVGPKRATRLSVPVRPVNRTGRELLPGSGTAGNLWPKGRPKDTHLSSSFADLKAYHERPGWCNSRQRTVSESSESGEFEAGAILTPRG